MVSPNKKNIKIIKKQYLYKKTYTMNYQKYSKDVMSIREFINKVNITGKLLKEGAFPQGEEQEYAEPTGEEEVGQTGEEPVMGEDSEMAGMQYVDQIRKAAIEGIEAFVDNVDSPSYDFFKKVFMMADKVLSQDEDNEK